MRFSELHLIKYGRFEDCDLAFPKVGATDLQLIYGPNEAGKSTTLAAVSDLLFGFPHSTTYDFRFDKQLLRVGAVIESDGQKLTCRRRKGNSATLLDDEERPIDEGGLATLIGGQTAETFHRMFSLDHRRLRDGGQAILDAKDDVGQAIFAAGSGLVGVARLLDALEEEAKAIWTRRAAADRTYYAAQRAYDEARVRLKAAQLKPAQWDDLRKSIAGLDEDLAKLRADRQGLETQRRRLERRRRILAPAAKRTLVLTALSALADVPALPADAPERQTEIEAAINAAETDRRVAHEQADGALKALTAICVNEALLDRTAEVEALREDKGAVEASLRDLPKRKAEIQTRSVRLAGLQREIGWPNEDAATVRNRMPSRVRVAEIRELLEHLGAAEAVAEGARSELAERKREAEDLARESLAAPPAVDADTLNAAVRFAVSKGDLDNVLGEAERQVQVRRRAVEISVGRLRPWTGVVETLAGMAPPSPTHAAEMASRINQAEDTLTRDRRSLKDDGDRLAMLELERDQTVRDEHAISAESLQEARAEREEVWAVLRGQLVGGMPTADPESSVETYEGRKRRADDLGDQRFLVAEQSGRLVALLEEIERVRLALEAGARRVEGAQRVVEGLQQAWTLELAPLGFSLRAADYATWFDRRAEALEATAQLEQAEAALSSAAEQRDRARQALRAALTAGGEVGENDVPTGVFVETAEARIRAAAEAAQARASNDVKASLTETAIKRAESRLAAADTAVDRWKAKWAPALTTAGFEADASPGVVRARLELLEEIRADSDEILGLGQRVEAMDSDVAAFFAKVAVLSAECGLTSASRPPEEQLSVLTAAANEATALAQRRQTHQGQLADAREREQAAIQSLRVANERLSPLLQAAGVGDAEALRLMLVRAVDRAKRQADLADVEVEIVSLGDGADLQTLLNEALDADPDALRLQSDGLQEQLVTLNVEIERLTEARASAAAEFDRLNDGPDAAIAASDLAQARSEMEVQAEAYVRIRTEAALLRWAIERYRREKQAPMLRRASSLFSTLTLGRYASLVVDTDGVRPQLSGLTSGGDQLVPVNGMSDGTVDQLYLALRLAAVEDAIAGGLKLPFLADDLFINYDDARAKAGFEVLAELAARTQVLFFTHHEHLLQLAEDALPPQTVATCRLGY